MNASSERTVRAVSDRDRARADALARHRAQRRAEQLAARLEPVADLQPDTRTTDKYEVVA